MNLSDQLSITARNHPDKTAFVFQDKETSYLELEGAVRKFASLLKELGYQQGDHIALVVGNRPCNVIGLYDAMWLGAVDNVNDNWYPAHDDDYLHTSSVIHTVIM